MGYNPGVLNIRDYVVPEPGFYAALRKGDWKLVWRATLPSSIELFNLTHDPSEQTNLADKNPQKVAELQRRIEALAQEAIPPLFVTEAFGTIKRVPLGFGAGSADLKTKVEGNLMTDKGLRLLGSGEVESAGPFSV